MAMKQILTVSVLKIVALPKRLTFGKHFERNLPFKNIIIGTGSFVPKKLR